MAKTPVFVKIEQYKELTQLIESTRDKIDQARTLLSTISELKAQEDQQLADWEAQLEDVEANIEGIDNTLVEPEL